MSYATLNSTIHFCATMKIEAFYSLHTVKHPRNVGNSRFGSGGQKPPPNTCLRDELKNNYFGGGYQP